MDWKFLLIGAVVGGAIAVWRVKSAPTAQTPYTPFGG